MSKPGSWIAVIFVSIWIGACGSAAQTKDGLNSDAVEHGAIQTEYGTFITVQQGRWGGNGKSTIMMVSGPGGTRSPVPFADSRYDESDPSYDSRYQRFCFLSTRPIDGTGVLNEPGDIWCAARKENGWAEPVRLPAPVNSAAREYSPSFDRNGILYFASDREGGLGQGDIYRAEQNGDGEWSVRNLGAAINSGHGEWNVGVHPDGKSMIFEASSRPENRSIPGDLYFSQQQDGEWMRAVPLAKLNSDSSDLLARWSAHDSIAFASARVGDGDVDHFSARTQDWMPIDPSLAVVSRSRGEVILLDPVTLNERRRIAVGKGPHEIASSADGRIAIVPLLGIYPQPHEEPVDKRPLFIAKASEGIAIVDLATGDIQKKVLQKCERPHGAATDAQAHRVWITCEDAGVVIELESENWTETRRFALQKGVHKVVYNQQHRTLVATNPDRGGLSSISLEDGAVASLKTGAGAEAIALSTDGKLAWVANSGHRTICMVRLETMISEWCVASGGSFPIALSAVEQRNEIWVSRLATSDIAILSSDTGTPVAEVTLESGALNLAVNVTDGLIYATLPRRNAIIAIDVESRKIRARFDNVMEGDDIDLIPANAFGPQTDS